MIQTGDIKREKNDETLRRLVRRKYAISTK